MIMCQGNDFVLLVLCVFHLQVIGRASCSNLLGYHFGLIACKKCILGVNLVRKNISIDA